jgi:hypothetical protein
LEIILREDLINAYEEDFKRPKQWAQHLETLKEGNTENQAMELNSIIKEIHQLANDCIDNSHKHQHLLEFIRKSERTNEINNVSY